MWSSAGTRVAVAGAWGRSSVRRKPTTTPSASRWASPTPGTAWPTRKCRRAGRRERPPVGQAHAHRPRRAGVRRPVAPGGPQRPRGPVEHRAHGVVELADAAEAGGEGDVGEGEVGGLHQGAGGLGPLGPGQGLGPGAHLGDEEALELAGAVAEAGGQAGHPLAVHHPVGDEPHGPGHHIGPGVPLRRSGRGIGPAPLARAEAGALGRGRGGEEADVGALRRHRRTAGPAVDPGRGDPDGEPAVEAGITAVHGGVAPVGVEGHEPQCRLPEPSCLAGIGHRASSTPARGHLTDRRGIPAHWGP